MDISINIIDTKKANKYAPLSPKYNRFNEFKINKAKSMIEKNVTI